MANPHLICGSPHPYIANDHGDLGLQINTQVFGLKRRVVSGAKEIVGAALINQWIGPKRGRHLDAACLANQFDVIDVRGAIDPLIGARQWGGHAARADRKRLAVPPRVQFFGNTLKLRRQLFPSVQRLLQRGGDLGHGEATLEIAAHHHQPTVAALLETC